MSGRCISETPIVREIKGTASSRKLTDCSQSLPSHRLLYVLDVHILLQRYIYIFVCLLLLLVVSLLLLFINISRLSVVLWMDSIKVSHFVNITVWWILRQRRFLHFLSKTECHSIYQNKRWWPLIIHFHSHLSCQARVLVMTKATNRATTRTEVLISPRIRMGQTSTIPARAVKAVATRKTDPAITRACTRSAREGYTRTALLPSTRESNTWIAASTYHCWPTTSSDSEEFISLSFFQGWSW